MSLKEHWIDGKLSKANVFYFKQADTLLKPLIKDYIPVSFNVGILCADIVTDTYALMFSQLF